MINYEFPIKSRSLISSAPRQRSRTCGILVEGPYGIQHGTNPCWDSKYSWTMTFVGSNESAMTTCAKLIRLVLQRLPIVTRSMDISRTTWYEKWYRRLACKAEGLWIGSAENMTNKYSNSGHPIFRCSDPLSRGVLERKGGGIFFESFQYKSFQDGLVSEDSWSRYITKLSRYETLDLWMIVARSPIENRIYPGKIRSTRATVLWDQYDNSVERNEYRFSLSTIHKIT